MDLIQNLARHADQPIPHQLIRSWLSDYKRPNDKIQELVSAGQLENVKRGLYIAGKNITITKPDNFLIANHILGPSYISLESALSYHGMIPEKVFEISSMTTKSARKFETPVGNFSYSKLSLPYYAYGLQRTEISPKQFILIATPEKALADKLINHSGVIRSTSQAGAYLIDDLRMDEERLQKLDTVIMKSWLPKAPKKDSLKMIINLIQSL